MKSQYCARMPSDGPQGQVSSKFSNTPNGMAFINDNAYSFVRPLPKRSRLAGTGDIICRHGCVSILLLLYVSVGWVLLS